MPRPLLLVPVEEHCRILAGSGDDVVLGLSDGTTMTGAEYLQEHFGDVLEVAAFHPAAGPVNMYHTERFANQKQRDLLLDELARQADQLIGLRTSAKRLH